MQLARTRLVLENARAAIQALAFQDTLQDNLIANHLTEYLLVVFYAEVEDFIEKTVFEKIRSNGNSEIAAFISEMGRSQIKRIKKSELADTLKAFSPLKRDRFNASVDESVVMKYQNFILNRHNISHINNSVTISWTDVQEIVDVGENILEKFQEAIEQNDQ